MPNCQTRICCATDATAPAHYARYFILSLISLWLVGCSPSDATPGQWLRGDAADTLPQDWAFTDEFKEIFVEVQTPYFIPHSVTIWCAQVDGKLFIGARDPESKNWPGWIDKNSDIRLQIDNDIYSVSASALSDEATPGTLGAAYAEKYSLPPPTDGAPSNMRYWAIVQR